MTEPRWLNADERRAWLALLSINTLLPAALDTQLQAAGKLSLFDYNVLAMLSEAEGRFLPMSELAARTSASLSRLSHVVTKLQRRGWVEREAHPRRCPCHRRAPDRRPAWTPSCPSPRGMWMPSAPDVGRHDRRRRRGPRPDRRENRGPPGSTITGSCANAEPRPAASTAAATAVPLRNRRRA